MAKKVKVTPKELKKPDRFREALANAIVFASENYRKILVAFCGLIIILAGAFVVTTFLEKHELDANSKFTEAMESYLKVDSQGKPEEALSKFLALRKEYPRAGVSKIALYYAAEINYNMGKYDESISLLNDFLRSGVKDEMLVDAAYLTLGMASFNKGNWQQAIDYSSKLDKEGNPYRDQAKLHIALSLEKLGKFSEAEEIHKQLLDIHSGNDFQLKEKSENAN